MKITTHNRKNNPQHVHGHLSTNSVGHWIEEDHADELTQRLHGAPEGSMLRIESEHTMRVAKSHKINEPLVGDDISCIPNVSLPRSIVRRSRIFLTIKSGLKAISTCCYAQQVTDKYSLEELS